MTQISIKSIKRRKGMKREGEGRVKKKRRGGRLPLSLTV